MLTLLAAGAAACQMTADYGGTRYACPDGECPDGFTCVAGECVDAPGPGGDEDGGPDDEDASLFDNDADVSPTLIAREVEDWDANVTQGAFPWVADSTAGHSGGGAMLAQGGGNDAIMWPDYYSMGSRLDYEVAFDAPGIYYVWIRGMSASGSDTCIPGVDGTGWADAANPAGALGVPPQSPADWAWGGKDHLTFEAIAIYVPSAGMHMVNVWLREDGVILDKILLTTDPDYQPSLLGPPAP